MVGGTNTSLDPKYSTVDRSITTNAFSCVRIRQSIPPCQYFRVFFKRKGCLQGRVRAVCVALCPLCEKNSQVRPTLGRMRGDTRGAEALTRLRSPPLQRRRTGTKARSAGSGATPRTIWCGGPQLAPPCSMSSTTLRPQPCYFRPGLSHVVVRTHRSTGLFAR